MLETQKYLRTGRTPEDLRDMYDGKIDIFYHDTLPLVGFNYRQDAPKFERIVRECRGLILELDTWNVVGKPMRRFFNFGESPEDDKVFDWNNFVATEKCDGTMIVLSYHLSSSQWIVSTRGTFGQHVVGSSEKTWEQLFWETSGLEPRRLSKLYTYVFELWTPHNRVIRNYDSPRVWLLSMTAMLYESCPEIAFGRCEIEAKFLGVGFPEYHHLTFADVVKRVQVLEEEDPTYEGFVLRDCNGNRIKLKLRTYIQLHHFFGNGNLYTPKRLVPIWLSGDYDEVVLRFPETKQHLAEVGAKCDEARNQLWELWRTVRDIEDQKAFALTIVPRTEFSAILFDIRKRYPEGLTREQFNDAWKQWPDLILKKLFAKETVGA